MTFIYKTLDININLTQCTFVHGYTGTIGLKVVFKYLWNRNFNATRAPERLKRSIMYTPVSMGGFGMVDIRTLGDSLDLRSYGRLLTTRHPFMTQIRELINYDNFFDVSVNVHVDKKLRRSIDLLNEGRRKILQ